MDENQVNLDQLQKRLESLVSQQEQFQREIAELQAALRQLKPAVRADSPVLKPRVMPAPPTAPAAVPPPPAMQRGPMAPNTPPAARPDLEKFIGENLANKIGIVITVLGVGIGAKYAIDRELISPGLRIILGYLSGLILLAFAVRLKKRYENFSAVLLSGSMAILYFITYFAYSFYALMPQAPAFGLMVLFTAATVYAALRYDRVVIAQYGLVGAYAVPFLLSNDSDRPGILFAYMAIINAGILVIAFRKYWTSLYYSSFFLTWLIFSVWYLTDFAVERHFGLALIFLTVFFLLFYATFLVYRSVQKESLGQSDVFLLLANAFTFYLLGCAILDDHQYWQHYLGAFTLGNAVFHGAISLIFYPAVRADRNLFYLISGLAIVFLVIAVPVQFHGNQVTLLWAGMAVLLFWISRTRGAAGYEKLAYPLIFLFFYQSQGWLIGVVPYHFGLAPEEHTPLLNTGFFTYMAIAGALGLIIWLRLKNPSPTDENGFRKIMRLVIPAMLLYVLYESFRTEINSYFWQLERISGVEVPSGSGNYVYNADLDVFNAVWLQIYSMLFLTGLALVNLKKIKSLILGQFNLALNMLMVGIFLVFGLTVLTELKESYLLRNSSDPFPKGPFYIGIRYAALAALGLLLVSCRGYVRNGYLPDAYRKPLDLLFHLTVLWVASSELIHWLEMSGFRQSDKIALSILWGVYALVLIGLGIYKKQRHLRLAAIFLFAATLVKLFFYDLTEMDAVAKTVVFVSLGVLLLVISFLYNKYKSAME